MKITVITTLILILFSSATLSAQHLSLSVVNVPKTTKSTFKKKYNKALSNTDSEYKLALNGAFYFYKEFLSSQDGDNCSFTPSCSEYAVLAVKEKGLLKGSVMFFDRYTRCNTFSNEFYKKDFKKKRLIDPVK
ncbi:MAG: membrane protein insertion efficiency factor YidD [Cyclobacteriaceae bacterium]